MNACVVIDESRAAFCRAAAMKVPALGIHLPANAPVRLLDDLASWLAEFAPKPIAPRFNDAHEPTTPVGTTYPRELEAFRRSLLVPASFNPPTGEPHRAAEMLSFPARPVVPLGPIWPTQPLSWRVLIMDHPIPSELDRAVRRLEITHVILRGDANSAASSVLGNRPNVQYVASVSLEESWDESRYLAEVPPEGYYVHEPSPMGSEPLRKLALRFPVWMGMEADAEKIRRVRRDVRDRARLLIWANHVRDGNDAWWEALRESTMAAT